MRVTYSDVDYDSDYAHVSVYVKHDGEPVHDALITGDLYSPASQVGGRTRIGIRTNEEGIAVLRVARLQYGTYRLELTALAHDEHDVDEETDRVISIRGLEDPEPEPDQEPVDSEVSADVDLGVRIDEYQENVSRG